MLFLVGCSGAVDINNLHDERMQEGCITFALDGASYFKLAAGELCKTVCTENLPEDFTYSFDRNGCKVNITNGKEEVYE
jgi:hypothetical protein